MTSRSFEEKMIEFREASAKFRSGGAKAVDAALAPLMQQPDTRLIGPLLLTLDDSATDDAGMFSLIHAAEQFEDKLYVDKLFHVLPQLYATAPKWTSIVFMRCLNNDETRNYLVRAIRLASLEVKQIVTRLCKQINARSPTFLSRTVPLLIAAK